MHVVNGQLRRVRGDLCNITVQPECTAEDILSAAVDKYCACNWHFNHRTTYLLLYPDGQIVRFLPGSTECIPALSGKVLPENNLVFMYTGTFFGR